LDNWVNILSGGVETNGSICTHADMVNTLAYVVATPAVVLCTFLQHAWQAKIRACGNHVRFFTRVRLQPGVR
jgi:hypothetical protein